MAVKKSVPDPKLHPVMTLKEHVVALDAAMLVAVTAAEVGAVHKLRTGTRRVEAYMLLLDVLEEPPRPAQIKEHAREMKVVERRLRKVRRAAGAVRDLDVQTEIIRYDMPVKAAVHDGTPGDAVRKQAKKLRKYLQEKRKDEAARLIATLKVEEQKLAAALRALEQVLKPASRPAIGPGTVQQHIQQWFTQQTNKLIRPASRKGKPGVGEEVLRIAIESLEDDALHTLRKAAKLCRYMAEGGPDDAAMRQIAEQFEAVQEAGGKWHDWLLLEQISSRFHGHRAELTRRYRKHRDASLAEYRLRLSDLLPVLLV